MRGGAFFNGKEGRDDFRKTSLWLRTLKKMPIFGKTNENAVSFYTCEQFSEQTWNLDV